MKNYSAIAASLLSNYPRAREYRVLEVGSDANAGLLAALAPHVREVVGLNLVGKEIEVASNARRIIGDIRKTDFEDNNFDLVVSYAVFEHVSDFGIALAEMTRVMKRGADLVSIFGPIWSCAWGHHLWITQPDRLTYVEPVVPPWAHLLFSRTEMSDNLVQRLSPKSARVITDYIFDSKDQNRLSLNDYKNFFRDSGLSELKVKCNRNKELENKYSAAHGCLESRINALVERFGPDDYLVASLDVLLRKW